MSVQTAGGLLARLRHVAATSGPAVMIAVPVVLAGALLFRGLEMSSLGGPKDVTLADGGQRNLLLSAVSGTGTDVKPALKPGLKPVTDRSAGLRRMASVHTVGVTRTGLRRVSLSRGSQLAMAGASSGTSGLFGGSGPGGGAAAERSSIRAHLVYERETTACPSLTTVISRGGLEGSLAVAISGAEAAARHRGGECGGDPGDDPAGGTVGADRVGCGPAGCSGGGSGSVSDLHGVRWGSGDGGGSGGTGRCHPRAVEL